MKEMDPGQVSDDQPTSWMELQAAIESLLVSLILKERSREVSHLDANTSLLDTGIIDSLFIHELIAYVESEFDIIVAPEEITPESFCSVREIACLILRSRELGGVGRQVDAFEILNKLMESYGLRRQWMQLSTGRHHLLSCPGDGPPLLLMSGLASPASSWGILMRTLNGKRETYALDLAGFGVSDAGDDCSVYRHIDNTIEVIDKVIGKPVILVGNSAGAMISAGVIKRRPDLSRALVVIGFGAIADGQGWWSDIHRLSSNSKAFWESAFYDPPPLNKGLEQQLARTLLSDAYLEFLSPEALDDLPGVFEGLSLPTMFVGGMNDRIVGQDIVEAGARQVPDARLEWIPRCGHYPQSERSEELLVYIEHFIKHNLDST